MRSLIFGYIYVTYGEKWKLVTGGWCGKEGEGRGIPLLTSIFFFTLKATKKDLCYFWSWRMFMSREIHH